MNEHKNPFSTFREGLYLCMIKSIGFLHFFDKRKRNPLRSYLLIVNYVTAVRVQGMVICIQFLNPSATVHKHIELPDK